MKSNKLTPLDAPFPEASAKILENYPQQDGYLLKLFRMWAHSPRHLRKFGAASLLDEESPLSIREREIVILRTTALKQCEYEWGVHVSIFSQKAGFNSAQIKNTLADVADESLWGAKDLLLIKVCDELQRSGMVSGETKEQFQSEFDIEAQLEVFALCGFYTTVAFTANSSEIGLEPFGAKFADFR